MPEVKFTNVVTFSSEDPIFKAENLITSSSKVRKWRSLTEGEPHLTAVLQMEKPVQIQSVDIGNDGSAFVEIQVGRRGSLKDGDFQVLLGAASFLTPIESRNSQNLNRVRMFGPEKFNSEVVKQNWDQIKIVCSQPFNKHVKYGLSFIKVHSLETETSSSSIGDASNQGTRLGKFKLRDENEEDVLMKPVSAGGLFASRRQQGESSPSVPATIRSEATLASIALSQGLSQNHQSPIHIAPISKKRAKQDGNDEFYQLKKVPAKKRKADDKPLPRRDGVPGETLIPTNRPNRVATPPSQSKLKQNDSQKKDFVPRPISSNKKRESRPFEKLFEGVVFAISGYQNPQRGQIRDIGLAMGAKYRSDWDSTCTHLVCAFPNTPKFREVKSRGGKIVKKEWFENGKKDRKRYPWRHFCLDPSDSGVESDTEIWASDIIPTRAVPSNSIVKVEEDNELDTDEEIEKLEREEKNKEKEKTKKPALKKDYDSQETNARDGKFPSLDHASEGIYSQDTPESSPSKSASEAAIKDEVDSDEAYNAETDLDEDVDDSIQKYSSKDLKLKSLLFEGKIFMLYGPFDSDERHKLNNAMKCGGGRIVNFLQSNFVDYVITREKWDRNFDSSLRKLPTIQFVQPEFVFESVKQNELLRTDKFKIRRK